MKIAFEERGESFCALLVEGEVWRKGHRAIWGKRPSLPEVTSLDELETAFIEFERRRVKGYILWRLSKENFHSEQMAHALKERLVSRSTITAVLEECRDLFDDDGWLRSAVASLKRRYGASIIERRLCAKGISREAVQAALEEGRDVEEESTALKKLIETRYRGARWQGEKGRQKMIASLQRKGYPLSMIFAETSREGVAKL